LTISIKLHGYRIGRGGLLRRPVQAEILHRIIAAIKSCFLSVTVPPESCVLAG